MRRILVEQARRKASEKHGGGRQRVDVEDARIAIELPSEDVLALEEALQKLEREDTRKAEVVMLRHFAGLTREETAKILGISVRTVEREWSFARALLRAEVAAPDAERLLPP